MLERAIDRLALTARGCDRVLRVARTVADLASSARVGADHLAEALKERFGRIAMFNINAFRRAYDETVVNEEA